MREHLDADVTAQRPAHHHALVQVELRQRLAHRLRQPWPRVGAVRIGGIARLAMAGQIESHQAVINGQRTLQQALEHDGAG